MGIGTGKMANRCPWALLPAGVYRAGTSRCRWCALTAPLHPCLCAGQARAIGGVFLWHCPHGHPHWALPSRPGHWGARTFLNRPRYGPEGRTAPIAITSPAFLCHCNQRPPGPHGRRPQRAWSVSWAGGLKRDSIAATVCSLRAGKGWSGLGRRLMGWMSLPGKCALLLLVAGGLQLPLERLPGGQGRALLARFLLRLRSLRETLKAAAVPRTGRLSTNSLEMMSAVVGLTAGIKDCRYPSNRLLPPAVQAKPIGKTTTELLMVSLPQPTASEGPSMPTGQAFTDGGRALAWAGGSACRTGSGQGAPRLGLQDPGTLHNWLQGAVAQPDRATVS